MQLLRYKAHTALACLEKARKTTPSRRIFKISKAFLCCIPCDTVYGLWLEWAPSVSMMSHILNWTHPKRIKFVTANIFSLSKRKTIEQESSIHYRLVHSTCYSERTCYLGFWLVKLLHFYSDHGEIGCNKKFIGHKDDSNWLAMALHRLQGGFTQQVHHTPNLESSFIATESCSHCPDFFKNSLKFVLKHLYLDRCMYRLDICNDFSFFRVAH